jgi:two-component system phosphate regulon response regulator OmpR
MTDDAAHILVVDDDARLRALLQEYLAESGFRVSAAPSAADARRKMAHVIFDLIVLDLMMPGETGLQFASTLRQKDSVPILMLTAMGEAESRIQGLEAGADDYLAKPFEPRELVLRINSILRRVPRVASDPLSTTARLGTVIFDMARDELSRDGQPIPLTSGEQRLLHMLAERPGIVFSREDLARILTPGGGERAIDVQVTRLRRKIEPDPKMPRYLQTVRGQGYILRPD